MVLASCGGGTSSTSDTDRYAKARQRLADVLHTSPDNIECSDFGSWEGRSVATCQKTGDTTGVQTGCYDIDNGDDLTLAIRGSENDTQLC
jgi:hypothetical protein